MIPKSDFRPLWDRLVDALGPPPHVEIRIRGLYEETKHLDLGALSYAVDCWIRGTGRERQHYARFPVPSDLIPLADRYMQGRPQAEHKSPYRQIQDCSDTELMVYANVLELFHRRNWEAARESRKLRKEGTGLGFLAMDGLLKKSYVNVRKEFERRYGKNARMPIMQVEKDEDPLRTVKAGDLPVVLEDVHGDDRRDAEPDLWESTGQNAEGDNS